MFGFFGIMVCFGMCVFFFRHVEFFLGMLSLFFMLVFLDGLLCVGFFCVCRLIFTCRGFAA